MKVKIVKPCWYKNTFYDPDTSVSDIYVEYPCKNIKELPSWAQAVEAAEKRKIRKTASKDLK